MDGVELDPRWRAGGKDAMGAFAAPGAARRFSSLEGTDGLPPRALRRIRKGRYGTVGSNRRYGAFRALLGLGGAIGFGLAIIGWPWGAVVDVGQLDPVFAEPAEQVEVRALSSGETLGGLLSSTMSATEQNRLLMAFREQASPRRMRVGTEILLRYRSTDEAERQLRGVDVSLSPDETVRLTLGSLGWSSELVRTPSWIDTIYAGGEIADNLWNAVIRNEGLASVPFQDRAHLIHHLDQVFQWQIDFSRQIQQGDSYRFALEREVRSDGTMRAGHLIAAELVNAGTSYHAIWFDRAGDGEGSYYDLDGKSVRRSFLLKPLEFRRISSQYANSRYHPILKTWRAHRGVDYSANTGTEVMATADGVVTRRGRDGSYGNLVEIRHPDGWTTRYAHLSAFGRIAVGSRVHQGEIIGYVGQTGLATAPHLHYELRRHGQPLDPLSIRLPPGEPVPDGALERWANELGARLALLDGLPGSRDGDFRRADGPDDGPDDET
ncbi:MAG TPA: peptidoglycan DD-metalloendopeptidase family protein [Longimicrobiales bacterium]